MYQSVPGVQLGVPGVQLGVPGVQPGTPRLSGAQYLVYLGFNLQLWVICGRLPYTRLLPRSTMSDGLIECVH